MSCGGSGPRRPGWTHETPLRIVDSAIDVPPMLLDVTP